VVQDDLEPGDRLLNTDGIIEARSTAGEHFGTDRLVEFAAGSLADGLPRRRSVHAILEYRQDKLQDTPPSCSSNGAAPPSFTVSTRGLRPA
jgi:serine phosphatase RsbU (regulator of sigma subunit)